MPVTVKPKKTTNAALAQLEVVRAQIEQRLSGNDDYKALVAVNRAINEIGGTTQVASATAAVAGKIMATVSTVPQGFDNFSQADATEVLLTGIFHEPTGTANLVKALGAHGITVGGDKPNINLSSVLSKDGRFRSVRYEGNTCWWVKGRPFPGELDFASKNETAEH